MFNRKPKRDPAELTFEERFEAELTKESKSKMTQAHNVTDIAKVKPNLDVAKARARTAKDAIEDTIKSNRSAIERNVTFINGCQAKIESHQEEIDRLEQEIKDTRSLNNAMNALIDSFNPDSNPQPEVQETKENFALHCRPLPEPPKGDE